MQNACFATFMTWFRYTLAMWLLFITAVSMLISCRDLLHEFNIIRLLEFDLQTPVEDKTYWNHTNDLFIYFFKSSIRIKSRSPGSSIKGLASNCKLHVTFSNAALVKYNKMPQSGI